MGAGATMLELDRPRHLRFDVNALADFEEAGGNLSALSSINAIRLLLWAGLKWNDRSMTKQVAGDLLQGYLSNGGDLNDLGVKLRDAMVKSGIVSIEGEGTSSGEVNPPSA